MTVLLEQAARRQLLASLRAHLHSHRPPPANVYLLSRSLSSLHPAPSIFRSSTSVNRPVSSAIYSRQLSLSSLNPWRRWKTPATPPPKVVAEIAALEAEANANPSDVQRQLALFTALTNTDMKPAYESIIARWDRMCEFDPANPFLRSDAAFEMYCKALSKIGSSASVATAARRRDSLLAAMTTSSAPASNVVPGFASSATVTDTAVESSSSTTSMPTVEPIPTAPASTFPAPTAPPVAPQPTPVLSASEQIAQAVLSNQASASSILGGAAQRSGDTRPLGGHDNPVVVTVRQHKTVGSWVADIVKFFVGAFLFVFLIIALASVALESTGTMKAGPRSPWAQPSQDKTYKFSDVHGMDEAKEDLQEVVEFLKDPSAFATLGGKLPKGILLTGPPGTGKTLLARAVAGEAGVPFFSASGSEFDEVFVGVGAKRIRELFAEARKKQSAIIFIDELDAVGGKRSFRDANYHRQTLNQLLVEMDGFLQTEGIVVMAATNFPDSLDPALVRPGRFDKHIVISLPDFRGRAQILKHHMKKVTVSPDVDTMILARGTTGFSGADLENLVNQAAVQAARERAIAVTSKHFEWARDKIMMGAERKSMVISEEEKLMTAYHEGGHALVALYTPGAMPLHKVTCMPRGHTLGVTHFLPEESYSTSLKQYLAQIDVSMGGRIAEELIYGAENVTSGASSDLRNATQTARAMVQHMGFSEKVGPVYYNYDDNTISTHTKDTIEEEIRRMLVAGEQRVLALLKSREAELHRLAHALVEHETLDADEVRKVVAGEPIRNIKEVVEDDLSRMGESQAA